MDEPVETNAQLRQHCVHIFPIHGLPHVLHLPTDVGTYLGAGLSRWGVHEEKHGKHVQSDTLSVFSRRKTRCGFDLQVSFANLFRFECELLKAS